MDIVSGLRFYPSLNCTVFMDGLKDLLPDNQLTCNNITINALQNTSSTSSESPTTTATPSISSQNNPTSSHNHSLSAGAKAGIGIGIVVFIALFLSIFYFVRHQRQIHLAAAHVAAAEHDLAQELPAGGPYVSE